MELFLNLVWVAISAAALHAWIFWRTRSSSREFPGMLRGVMVVVCILVLLFPVISISDDLSQAPSLAEGNRLQDVLKAPELRGIYHVATILPAVLLAVYFQICAPRHISTEVPAVLHEIFWSPVIEKRPPPRRA